MYPPLNKKITVLIPCFNEERGICAVVKSFPIERIRTQGYDLEIVVIDNNSNDRTAELAKSCGATVIHEPKKGKGNAIRAGFFHISKDTDYVVMLDGDDTYRPEEILRLVEPLDSNFCDVVIGSRLGGRISEGSMTTFNRIGNWVFSHLVRYFYRVNVTDVLTGYFAWKREALVKLRPHLLSQGFAIEMEMVTKMAKLGEEIYSVPISYHARAGETNLRPIYDGSRILWMFLKNLTWNPRPQKIKRIAFVSDSIMPYHKGGKERRLYEISKRLVSDIYEVHIYTMKWWSGPKIIKYEGVYLHAISKLYPLYSGDRRSVSQAILFGLATFKLIFEKFDVLDVDHMPFFPLFSARIVAWLKGKKLYATWHEVWGRAYWIEYMKGLSGIIGYTVEKLSFLMPDVIISNSKHTTNSLRLAGFKKEIKTVSLGVDLESIYNAKASENKSDVIFVGRLLSHKNADILVGAIATVKKNIPGIVCKIVGTGPEKQKIEELIKKLKLQDNVQVLDNTVNDIELYGLMKASKILVLPSVREGFGIIVIEANAAGLPVITTSHDNNAAKDLIYEGVNGLLAEQNKESFAEKILQVINNRNTMTPRHGIKEYDWGSVVYKLRRNYLI